MSDDNVINMDDRRPLPMAELLELKLGDVIGTDACDCRFIFQRILSADDEHNPTGEVPVMVVCDPAAGTQFFSLYEDEPLILYHYDGDDAKAVYDACLTYFMTAAQLASDSVNSLNELRVERFGSPWQPDDEPSNDSTIYTGEWQ